MESKRVQTPSEQPQSRVAAVLLIVGIVVLILAVGTGIQLWRDYTASLAQGGRAKFDGQSEHWDHAAIPISLQCAKCHPEQFKAWAASDHAWAFRKLDSKWDAQAFHGLSIAAHHSTIHFTTEAGGAKRHISDRGTGKTWHAQWATGRTPLVQYLVPAQDGGFHTLSAAWDTKRNEWFDIFLPEQRTLGDWGHWMGRGMNWNSQCAWCHTSHFQKNYDYRADKYASTWVEPGVTCIQCHGPLLDKPEPGTGCMIATKATRPESCPKPTPRQAHDNCASCHARRDEFDHDFRIESQFDDHFQLVLPVHEGIFWPNGMQRDEDYCETGLRLSKMGKAGVTCMDCHDPHSAKLKLPQENNLLCLRCHATGEKVGDIPAPIIDMTKHTPCPTNSMGGRCVECHNPETTYMGRDPRRDHSFNSPDPLISKELGIPNACIMCHKDKSDDWAMEAILRVYGITQPLKMLATRDRTRAVQAAYTNKPDALEKLLAVYPQQDNGTWRATLLEILDPWADDPRVQAIALQALKDTTPLARAAAVKLVGRVTPQAAQSALQDSSRVVRLQAAWAMRESLKPEHIAMQELIKAALHQSDQPSGAMKLATLELATGNPVQADHWFRRARDLDSTSAVVHRDYAVFLAGQGKAAESLAEIKHAFALAPQNASMAFMLGLSYVENKDYPNALEAFTMALELDSQFIRARYNRALLYHSLRKLDEAIADLTLAAEHSPADAEIPYTLATIYYAQKDYAKSAAAAAEALRRNPNHREARALLQRSMSER